jgi:hypothetical protein
LELLLLLDGIASVYLLLALIGEQFQESLTFGFFQVAANSASRFRG